MPDLTRPSSAYDRAAPKYAISDINREALRRRGGAAAPNASAVLTPTSLETQYNMPHETVVSDEQHMTAILDRIKAEAPELIDLASRLYATRRAALEKWCRKEGVAVGDDWAAWQMRDALGNHLIERHRELKAGLAALGQGAG